MATGTLKVCDICGVEHSPFIKRSWEDSIDHATISFKLLPGLQSIPFEGDICTYCARGLQSTILLWIEEKKIKHQNDNK